MEAFLGLGGVVIGGLLVTFTDFIRYRRDRKERRLTQLRVAVSDVLATYLDARSKLIAERRAGVPVDRRSLFPAERSVALARLFTLPGSEVLQDQIVELGLVTLKIIDAPDEDAREVAYNEQLALVRGVEAAVRHFG
jgi:hypothetical protein